MLLLSLEQCLWEYIIIDLVDAIRDSWPNNNCDKRDFLNICKWSRNHLRWTTLTMRSYFALCRVLSGLSAPVQCAITDHSSFCCIIILFPLQSTQPEDTIEDDVAIIDYIRSGGHKKHRHCSCFSRWLLRSVPHCHIDLHGVIAGKPGQKTTAAATWLFTKCVRSHCSPKWSFVPSISTTSRYLVIQIDRSGVLPSSFSSPFPSCCPYFYGLPVNECRKRR